MENLFGKKVVILDGAMGTMLQNLDLKLAKNQKC